MCVDIMPGGKVDRSRILAALADDIGASECFGQLRVCLHKCGRLPQPDDIISLVDLLVQAVEARAWRVASILVWQVGSAIDADIASKHSPHLAGFMGVDSGNGEQAVSRPSKAGTGRLTHWREWRQREVKLAKYWMAGKRVCGAPQVLSMTVDSTRLANKNHFQCMLCLPSNIAMVACPQAESADATRTMSQIRGGVLSWMGCFWQPPPPPGPIVARGRCA